MDVVMKKRIVLIILALCIFGALGIILWDRTPEGTPSDTIVEKEVPVVPETPEEIATVEVEEPIREEHETLADSASVETVEKVEPDQSESVEDSPQVIGSLRMYQAHASLRQSAVNDPNSPENKEILETMVFKALSRSGEEESEPSVVN